jgi:hypothetical protein
MIGTSVAIYFAFKNGKKNDNDDLKQRIEDNTKITMKLDNISDGISEIKKTMEKISNDVQKHNDKLIEHDMQIKDLLRRVKDLEQ